MTLSGIAELIIDKFLPDTYQKYLLLNYKQSPQYRSYKSFIPPFLHGRPRSIIVHCLERRSKSLKYTQEDVTLVSNEGIFTVKGSKGSKHTVSFGVSDDSTEPSCTCRDWVEWHIPCKRFWAIFTFYPSWNWDAFPVTYRKSAYLSRDIGALNTFFSNEPIYDAEQESSSSPTDVSSTPVQDEIPKQKVRISGYF